jgi:light-regulated signal transduction histidine kinase (bacteriophytochrome)
MSEAELARLQRELDELQAEYEEFAYVVSHDFATPFRQVEGFVRLLEPYCVPHLDEKQRRHFAYLSEAASAGQELLLAMLEFSRLRPAAMKPEPQDLNQLFAEACKRLQRLKEERHATITAAVLPEIIADRDQMARLFYQLLKNALLYHEDGAQAVVDLQYEQRDDQHVLILRDNGTGFTPGAHLFTPLRRGTGDPRFPGKGMGLAQAHKIMRLHHGSIDVHSAPGEGTQVTLRFPITIP